MDNQHRIRRYNLSDMTTLDKLRKSVRDIVHFVAKFESKMASNNNNNYTMSGVTERLAKLKDKNINPLYSLEKDIENGKKYNEKLFQNNILRQFITPVVINAGVNTPYDYHVISPISSTGKTPKDEFMRYYMTPLMDSPEAKKIASVTFDLETVMGENGIGVSETQAIYQFSFQRDYANGENEDISSIVGVTKGTKAYDTLESIRVKKRDNIALSKNEVTTFEFVSRVGEALGENGNDYSVDSNTGIISLNRELNADERVVTYENFKKGLKFLTEDAVKAQSPFDLEITKGRKKEIVPGSIRIMLDAMSKFFGGDKVFSSGQNTKKFDIRAFMKNINENPVYAAYAKSINMPWENIKNNFDTWELQSSAPDSVKNNVRKDLEKALQPDNIDEILSYSSGELGIQRTVNGETHTFTNRYLRKVSLDYLDLMAGRVTGYQKGLKVPFGYNEKSFYRIMAQIGALEVDPADERLLKGYHYSREDITYENFEKGFARVKNYSLKATDGAEWNDLLNRMLKVQNNPNADPIQFESFNVPRIRKHFAEQYSQLNSVLKTLSKNKDDKNALVKKDELEAAVGKGRLNLELFFKEQSDYIKNGSIKLAEERWSYTEDYVKNKKAGSGSLERINAYNNISIGRYKSFTHHDAEGDTGQSRQAIGIGILEDDTGLAVMSRSSAFEQYENAEKEEFIETVLPEKVRLSNPANKVKSGNDKIIVQAVQGGSAKYLRDEDSIYATSTIGGKTYVSDGYSVSSKMVEDGDKKDKDGKQLYKRERIIEPADKYFSPLWSQDKVYELYNFRALTAKQRTEFKRAHGLEHSGFLGTDRIISFDMKTVLDDNDAVGKSKEQITTVYVSGEEFDDFYQRHFKTVQYGNEITRYGKALKEYYKEQKDEEALNKAESGIISESQMNEDLSKNYGWSEINAGQSELKTLENASNNISIEGKNQTLARAMVVQDIADANNISVEDIEKIVQKISFNNNAAIQTMQGWLDQYSQQSDKNLVSLSGISKDMMTTAKMWNYSAFEIDGAINFAWESQIMQLAKNVNGNSLVVQTMKALKNRGIKNGKMFKTAFRHAVAMIQDVTADYSERSDSPVSDALGIVRKINMNPSRMGLEVKPWEKSQHPGGPAVRPVDTWTIDLHNPYSLKKRIINTHAPNTRKSEHNMILEFLNTEAPVFFGSKEKKGYLTPLSEKYNQKISDLTVDETNELIFDFKKNILQGIDSKYISSGIGYAIPYESRKAEIEEQYNQRMQSIEDPKEKADKIDKDIKELKERRKKNVQQQKDFLKNENKKAVYRDEITAAAKEKSDEINKAKEAAIAKVIQQRNREENKYKRILEDSNATPEQRKQAWEQLNRTRDEYGNYEDSLLYKEYNDKIAQVKKKYGKLWWKSSSEVAIEKEIKTRLKESDDYKELQTFHKSLNDEIDSLYKKKGLLFSNRRKAVDEAGIEKRQALDDLSDEIKSQREGSLVSTEKAEKEINAECEEVIEKANEESKKKTGKKLKKTDEKKIRKQYEEKKKKIKEEIEAAKKSNPYYIAFEKEIKKKKERLEKKFENGIIDINQYTKSMKRVEKDTLRVMALYGYSNTLRDLKKRYNKITVDNEMLDDARLTEFLAITREALDAHRIYANLDVGRPNSEVYVAAKSAGFTEEASVIAGSPEEAEKLVADIADKAKAKGEEEIKLSHKDNMRAKISEILTGGTRVQEDFENSLDGLSEYHKKQKRAIFETHKKAIEGYAGKIFGLLDSLGATIEIDDEGHIVTSIEGQSFDLTRHLVKLDTSGGSILYNIGGTIYGAKLNAVLSDDGGEVNIESAVESISRKFYSKKNFEDFKSRLESRSRLGIPTGVGIVQALKNSLKAIRKEEVLGSTTERNFINNATIDSEEILGTAFQRKRLLTRLNTVVSDKRNEDKVWYAHALKVRRWLGDQPDIDGKEELFVPTDITRNMISLFHHGVIDTNFKLKDKSGNEIEFTPTAEQKEGKKAWTAMDIHINGSQFDWNTRDPKQYLADTKMVSKEVMWKRAKDILKGKGALRTLAFNDRIVDGTMQSIDVDGIEATNSFGVNMMKMGEDSIYRMANALGMGEDNIKNLTQDEIDARNKFLMRLNHYEGGGFITAAYADVMGYNQGTKLVDVENKDFIDQDEINALNMNFEKNADGTFSIHYNNGYYRKKGENIVKVYSSYLNDEAKDLQLKYSSKISRKFVTKTGGMILSEEEATRFVNDYITAKNMTITSTREYENIARQLLKDKIIAESSTISEPLKIISKTDTEKHEVATGHISIKEMKKFAKSDSEKEIFDAIIDSNFAKFIKEDRGVDIGEDILSFGTYKELTSILSNGTIPSFADPMFLDQDIDSEKSHNYKAAALSLHNKILTINKNVNIEKMLMKGRYALDDIAYQASEAIDPRHRRADVFLDADIREGYLKHNIHSADIKRMTNLLTDKYYQEEEAAAKKTNTHFDEDTVFIKSRERAIDEIMPILPGADKSVFHLTSKGDINLDESLAEIDYDAFKTIIEKKGNEEVRKQFFGGLDQVETITIGVTENAGYNEKVKEKYRDVNQIGKLIFDSKKIEEIAQDYDESITGKSFDEIFGGVGTFKNGKFVLNDGYEGRAVFGDYITRQLEEAFHQGNEKSPTRKLASRGEISKETLDEVNAIYGKNVIKKPALEEIESYRIAKSAMDINNQVVNEENTAGLVKRFGYTEVNPMDLEVDYRNQTDLALRQKNSIFSKNYVFNLENEDIGITKEFLAQNGVSSTKLYVPKGFVESTGSVLSMSEYTKNAISISEKYKQLDALSKNEQTESIIKEEDALKSQIVEQIEAFQSNLQKSIVSKEGTIGVMRKILPSESTRMRTTLINVRDLVEGKETREFKDFQIGESGKYLKDAYLNVDENGNITGKGRHVGFAIINTKDLEKMGVNDDYFRQIAVSIGRTDDVDSVTDDILKEVRANWIDHAKTHGIEALSARQPNDYFGSISAVRMYLSDNVQSGMIHLDSITAAKMKADSDGDNTTLTLFNSRIGNNIVDSFTQRYIQGKIDNDTTLSQETKEKYKRMVDVQKQTFARAEAYSSYVIAKNGGGIWNKGMSAKTWEDIDNNSYDLSEPENLQRAVEEKFYESRKGRLTRNYNRISIDNESKKRMQLGYETIQEIFDRNPNLESRKEWNAIKKEDWNSQNAFISTFLSNNSNTSDTIDISAEEEQALKDSITANKISNQGLVAMISRLTRLGAGEVDTPFDAIDMLAAVSSYEKFGENLIPRQARLSYEDMEALSYVKESAKEGFLTPKKMGENIRSEHLDLSKTIKDQMNELIKMSGTADSEKAENAIIATLTQYGNDVTARYNNPFKNTPKDEVHTKYIQRGIKVISRLASTLNDNYKSINGLRRGLLMNDPDFSGIHDSDTINKMYGMMLKGNSDKKIKPLFKAAHRIQEDLPDEVLENQESAYRPDLVSPLTRGFSAFKNAVSGNDFKFTGAMKGAGIVFGALSLLGSIGGNPATPVQNNEAQQRQQNYPRMNGVPPQNSQAMPQFLSSNLNTIRQGPNRGYIINVDARSDYDNEYTSNLISAAVQNHYDNTHVNIAMNINQQRNEMSSNDIMNYLQTSL